MRIKAKSKLTLTHYPGIAVGVMTRNDSDEMEDGKGNIAVKTEMVMHELYIPFLVLRYTTVYITANNKELLTRVLADIKGN